MQISSKAVRAVLLMLALALSGTALGYSLKAAECANGTNRFIKDPGVCCTYTQRWKGQSCIYGVWTNNGAVRCEGPCAH